MIQLDFVTQFGSGELKLPNAVCVLEKGKLVVADGGNDSILIYSNECNLERSIGGTGLGRYKLKEPVAVSSDGKGRIFVADWHNQRVVLYNEQLTYLGEFGHPAVRRAGERLPQPKRLAYLIYSLFWSGTYIKEHFSESGRLGHRRLLPTTEIFRSLLYFLRQQLSTLIHEPKAFKGHGFEKPNGFSFLDKNIWITQKNAKCVTIHEDTYPFTLLRKISEPRPGLSFGRLGNVTSGFDGSIYICDEHRETIWHYDNPNHEPKKLVGEDSGSGYFMPFSCAQLNHRLIAVCGGFNIQIINIFTREVIWVSERLGELHGVAWDEASGRLYVVNRSEGVIQVFSFSGSS